MKADLHSSPRKILTSISDLTPDPDNVNRGSERGNHQLDWSLTEFGPWRSIAASSDGVIAAGNKTLDIAVAHGFEIKPVHVSGNELVVVIRDDIDSADPRFRQYAIADNRVSELNYVPDAEVLLRHMVNGIDLTPMFREDELKALMDGLSPDGGEQEDEDEDGGGKSPVTCPNCSHIFTP